MGNVACCTASADTATHYSDQKTQKAVEPAVLCDSVTEAKTAAKLSSHDSDSNLDSDNAKLAVAPAATKHEPVPTEMILNMLHPEDGPAAGLPYQPHFLGAPTPPGNEQRVATVRALHAVDDPADPEVGSILKTVASIFKAPAALVAKFDDKRVYISDSEGVMPRGDFPWRWTLCAWSLAYKNPQVLVVPDTLQDSRFRHNEKVTSGPKVRFYCGAPLVASNGQRLGTICFLDVKPREFDASSAFIMNNFAELVVRRLEKDIALRLTEKKNKELAEVYGGLQRAIDTVDTCVIMVDTEAEGWGIVYTNAAFSNTTGLDREAVMGKALKEIMTLRNGNAIPTDTHVKQVAKCQSFAIDGVRFEGSNTNHVYTLNWRPACRALDDSMVAVGVPSFLRPQAAPGEEGSVSPSHYYFVTVELGKERHCSVNSYNSMNSVTSVDGLQMAHLLGKGAFGSVYAGTWWNAPVAVKIVEQELKPLCPGMASLEAVLGTELRHPHIVTTLHYTTRKVQMNTTVTDSANEGSGDMTSSVGTAQCTIVEESEDANSANIESGQKLWTVINSVPDKVEEEGDEEAAEGDGKVEGATVLTTLDPVPTKAITVDAGKEQEEVPVGVKPFKQPHVAGMNSAGDVPDTVDNQSWSGVVAKQAANGKVVAPGDNSQGVVSNNSSIGTQTMIILEFCDKGCLQEAIDRGWLQNQRSSLYGGVNLDAVLATAREIASAMAFLHSHRIVHGDLSAWNVMLSSSNSSLGSRGFTAKVADFGLARNLHDTSRLMTNTYGTITHMPPETLNEGVISFAMDVYSYGVLLWQMYTSSRPWSGLRFPQIVMMVGQQHKQLQFLPGSQPGYVKLAHDCMAADPKARPTFDQILVRLSELSDAIAAELCPEPTN